MAEWSTFVTAVGVLLAVLLVLARVSSTVLSEAVASGNEPLDSAQSSTDSSLASQSTSRSPPSRSTTHSSPTHSDEPMADGHTDDPIAFDESAAPPESQQIQRNRIPDSNQPTLSTAALLANVVFTQGLFAGLLVALAWYTEIPAWAFGLATDHVSASAVGLGILIGGVFYMLNEALVRVAQQYGMTPPTALREALAPETPAGWVVLFVVVLPVIAGFEELLFRGALIGVVHAGFEIPLWLLAIGSSAVFGLGHGAQGRVGILITGLLGVGLAGVFIWTGNLIVVIVAHYVSNALEFAIHEWK